MWIMETDSSVSPNIMKFNNIKLAWIYIRLHVPEFEVDYDDCDECFYLYENPKEREKWFGKVYHISSSYVNPTLYVIVENPNLN